MGGRGRREKKKGERERTRLHALPPAASARERGANPRLHKPLSLCLFHSSHLPLRVKQAHAFPWDGESGPASGESGGRAE